ncbi:MULTISPECIES: DNA-binding protein [unclassified Methanoregula]|uniref:DNA-binding protein n=1 Tax=unclassified Methanoregula TaxID=2649730 RepID=UPI0009D5ABC5|nr:MULTISPECIES: DNA-binding protein [unclassified Methanoregula]OPX64469.1 MAG: DNA-binding protein [Methanoregula sp. PtaB.Bin085]OPY35868.1 MAG: DNA-binding protein [Methanoregula sp. PtaU1.Bin006]
MGDDELAELRRRRMAQLQQQAGDQQAMQEELERQQRLKSQIQMVLMQILEPDARERLNTIKLTKPEFAGAVEQQLVALAQSGRLQKKITDAQLKELLRQLAPQKRDYSITRR